MNGRGLGGGVHKKLVPAAVQSEKIESEGDHAARLTTSRAVRQSPPVNGTAIDGPIVSRSLTSHWE